MKKKHWLKKYTKLEYLEGIINHRQLHLGDPSTWDDKNDSECIRLYSEWSGKLEMRATCLTAAPDRFHFWHIFGEKKSGVCLWFDRASLCKDIGNDASLIARNVEYPTHKELRYMTPSRLPFVKREQYKDECEFRVLRTALRRGTSNEKFNFSAHSLKRIYLNPWLRPAELKAETSRVSEMLGRECSHVDLKQNRSLKKREWIDEASACIKNQ